MYNELLNFLKVHDVEYKENTPLATISPIKIGGDAAFVVFADSEHKLVALVDFLVKLKIRYKILGRMSNVLPLDEKYDGVVIRTDRLASYTIVGESLTVSCGAGLPYVASILMNCGLSGFEGLSGIPGSIGGAILGNAGAFGSEISDRLINVRAYDLRRRRIIVLSRADCCFTYRGSVFKDGGYIILSADFLLCRKDAALIKADMDRCRNIRKNTQPYGLPSLGSTFKRPSEGIYAARLIDDCGLKGYTVGGAQISNKHAGFIVNIGGATAKDYIDLSSYAAKCVYDRFNIRLEREIEIM